MWGGDQGSPQPQVLWDCHPPKVFQSLPTARTVLCTGLPCHYLPLVRGGRKLGSSASGSKESSNPGGLGRTRTLGPCVDCPAGWTRTPSPHAPLCAMPFVFPSFCILASALRVTRLSVVCLRVLPLLVPLVWNSSPSHAEIPPWTS